MPALHSMVHKGIETIEDFAKISRFSLIFLISFTILVSVISYEPAFASTTFTIQDVNLSNSAAIDSITPKIAVDDSNVYVIWHEGADIFFDKSSDGGTTFAGPVNLSNTGTVVSLNQHQISVAGSNIYAVWQDGNDVFVRSSTDSGATFGLSANVSSSGGVTSTNPQIASIGNSAYVIWRDVAPNDILFSRSTDSGATFSASSSLNPVGSGFTPDITAEGTNVYATWRDGNEIFFARSTDSGATFLAPADIGDKGFINDPKPLVSASGTNVYVVWRESLGISFVKSSDSGATFDPKISLDATNGVPTDDHKMAVSGNNVYVVWQGDSDDVSFIQSTDGGDTFDAEINLSQTGENSLIPDIAAGSVYVVWREDTTGNPDDKDIHFVSSDTDGSNFGGIQTITNNGILASEPQVASSGNDVYLVWSESTTAASGDGEIKFSKGSVTTTSIDFPGPYKMTDTATITVTDSTSNTNSTLQEMILVNVTSGIDPAGLLVTATENGTNSNDFVAMITFGLGASAGTTLQATPVPPQNTLSASFGGISSGTTISPRSIVLDSTSYDLGDIAFVTVTDQNSNLDSNVKESIVVDLTTQESGDAETITLHETGLDTGVFGGNGNVEVIFSEGDNRFPTSGSATLTVNDNFLNLSNSTIDSGWVNVTSSSDTQGINFTVLETGINTSTFTGQITLTTGASNEATGNIHVEGGDFLTVLTEPPTFRLNALIIPNPNESRELLDVLITDILDENITASFGGVSDSATVGSSGAAPGGGGGGLIRPGLVFDVLAGAKLFGGGSGSSVKPSISSTSLSIDVEPSFTQQGEGEFGGILTEKKIDESSGTQYVKIGKPMELKFDLYENKGFENVMHLGIYILDKGEKKDPYSSTYIIYDKFKGTTINDPNGILDDATISMFKTDATTGIAKISLTFNQAVGEKDFFINLWDQQKNSNEWRFDGAITVIESSGEEKSAILDSTEIIQEDEKQQLDSSTILQENDSLPNDEIAIKPWIKTTAKWWVDNQVSEKDFLMVVEHLIDEGIVEVPPDTPTNTGEEYVPEWYKTAAGLWGDGTLSDKEFTDGLAWLIENGVMKV